MMEYFAEVVFSNGGVRWQMFFEYSPNDVAKTINTQSVIKFKLI
ncbi:hypothetical protein BTHERMOSOX_1295 [Bathymodiolus thermophilus thioautotrophic gill symbiont]|nr:hypothetical protein BTHERMOSOX_1295 [Bathymodiolus thermophilus thioautotrophic gill symbiont]